MIDSHRILVEAGLLPAEMPANYTFNKVRKILSELDDADSSELDEAIAIASGLEIRGALAAVIFIKHHLGGRHEAELDRVVENEGDGTKYGVLVYPEGEVPIDIRHLPEGIREGSRLIYEPGEGRYTSV